MAHIEHDLKILSRWEVGEIANWLLRAYNEPPDFDPMEIPVKDCFVEDYVKSLYVAAKGNSRVPEKLRAATAAAVARYSALRHSSAVLERLALTVAYIRAEEAIPLLASKIVNGQLAPVKSVEAVIAALAGFVPDSRIRRLFNVIYRKQEYSHWTPMIYLALIRCDHKNFVSKAHRFIEYINSLKNASQLDAYFVEFATYVAPDDVGEAIQKMTKENFRPLLDVLFTQPFSPYLIEPTGYPKDNQIVASGYRIQYAPRLVRMLNVTPDEVEVPIEDIPDAVVYALEEGFVRRHEQLLEYNPSDQRVSKVLAETEGKS